MYGYHDYQPITTGGPVLVTESLLICIIGPTVKSN